MPYSIGSTQSICEADTWHPNSSPHLSSRLYHSQIPRPPASVNALNSLDHVGKSLLPSGCRVRPAASLHRVETLVELFWITIRIQIVATAKEGASVDASCLVPASGHL